MDASSDCCAAYILKDLNAYKIMQRNNSMVQCFSQETSEIPNQNLTTTTQNRLLNLIFPRVHALSWGLPNLADRVVTKKPEIFGAPDGETGQDRLKLMFFRDEFGELSVELAAVAKNCFAATLTGYLFGGLVSARNAREQFTKAHAATQFVSELDARRRLLDNMVWNFIKGGAKVGWRLGIFSGIFFLTSSSITTYRNKLTVFDFMAGGALAGGLYRWKNGIKAITSTTVVGGFLGLVTGMVLVGSAWLSGTSYEEIRYWRNQTRMKHNSEIYRRMQKRREAKDPLESERAAALAENAAQMSEETNEIDNSAPDRESTS